MVGLSATSKKFKEIGVPRLKGFPLLPYMHSTERALSCSRDAVKSVGWERTLLATRESKTIAAAVAVRFPCSFIISMYQNGSRPVPLAGENSWTKKEGQ